MENINGIYHYLEMIRDPTTLTTSSYLSHHFGPSYSMNNDIEYLLLVIAALCMIQKSICELCGRIGDKAHACIIRGPEKLPSSLRRKMNQLNSLHGK